MNPRCFYDPVRIAGILLLASAALLQPQVIAFAPMRLQARPHHVGGTLQGVTRHITAHRRPRCLGEEHAALPHQAESAAPAPGVTDTSDTKPVVTGAERGVVPSYRRLYDAAMELIESKLELDVYPIPEGLGKKSAVVGKGRNQQRVETSITAFRCPKFRQIRAALVETDGPTQVLNFVMFPDPSYDLPIFGADLVSLPGVHLVCIDLQPMYSAQTLGEKTQAALKELKRRHLEGLPLGGDLPEAARKYFSPYCLWSKLDPTQAVEDKALEAMMDYLQEFLRLVAEAEPESVDSALASVAAEGQADYCHYRRVNDPARGMLTRFYGTDWTEAAINGVLFDFRLTQQP